MAAVVSAANQAANLLEDLSIDSQVKTVEIPGPAKKGTYSDNGTATYHQGYGYTPFGSYQSPNSAVPTMGYDGQLYGTQQYQYSFYQPPTSSAAGNPNNIVNAGSIGGNTVSKQFRPSNQNSNVNSSYRRGTLPTGYNSWAYLDPRYGYDGYQSWFDASIYSNGPSRHSTGAGFSSALNSNPTRPASGLGQGSGYMNFGYPNRLYGQYGSKSGAGFGSFSYNLWTNGGGWVVADNKLKPQGCGYGNENMDGLSEMNRGPRAKGFKNPKEIGDFTEEVDRRNLPLTENFEEEHLSEISDKEKHNGEDFPESYSDAKFFVIKSYSEDDVHKSIKYGVWTSTPNGNKKLDAAYQEAKEKSSGCPVFLLFSVNTSGQFVGLAEMTGPVDFNKTVAYWQQDKWFGCFPVKWHIIKDVPNNSLRHITLENNENKPVTNSRDTQEVIFEKGIEILKIFKRHKGKTSIVEDFGFYAARERIMQQKRAKQKIQNQILDGKFGDDATDKDKAAITGIESSLKSVNNASFFPTKLNGEAKLQRECGSDATAKFSALPAGEKAFADAVAGAC